ncbi:hypothetical protein EJB05_25269, partial [Eragrostis curvula]
MMASDRRCSVSSLPLIPFSTVSYVQRAEENDEHDEEAADHLSALPDDILLNILERLRLRPALQTSILSRRWRRLPLQLSRLVIDVSEFMRQSPAGSRTVPRLMASYAEAARRLLLAPAVKPKVLSLVFYLAVAEDPSHLRSIGQAVGNAAVAAEFVGLELLPELSGSDCSGEHSALYGQRFMSLLDDCPGAFGCLTFLKLCGLRFAESDLPRVLSTCHSLQELRLHNCGDSNNVLRVDAPPSSQLVTLKIFRCHFARVELIGVPRLARLYLHSWLCPSSPPLHLGHVPQLRYVWLASVLLSFQEPFTLSQWLSNARNLSTVCLNFRDNMVWIRPEDPKLLRPVLGNLKDLYLNDIFYGCDLDWTLSFLEAAPSLNSFHVNISWHACFRDDQVFRATPAEKTNVAGEVRNFKHRNLEFLEIGGFNAEVTTMITFTRLVMERAVNLKRIRLHGMERCKHCDLLDGNQNPSPTRWPSLPGNEDERKLVREQLIRGFSSSIQIMME